MAVAARKLEEYEYFDMPATRVYSHAPQKVEARIEPKKQPILLKKPMDAKRRAERKESFRKALMLMNIGLAAGAILIVLSRYSLITLEYQKVNELKSDISQIELEIKALNVRFNSAVSIEAAKSAAAKAGMRYPTAGQIVMVEGEALDGAMEYEIEFEG